MNNVYHTVLLKSSAAQIPQIALGNTMDSAQLQGDLERLPYSLGLVIEGIMWKIIPIIIQAVIAAGVIFYLMPAKYSIVLTITLIAYGLFSYLSAKEHETSSLSTNQAMAELSMTLGDTLKNPMRIISNGTLTKEVNNISNKSKIRTMESWRRSGLLVKMALYQYTAIGIGLVALFAMCAIDLSNSHIKISDFVLLQAYAFQFAILLGSFGFLLRQAGPAFENINTVFSLSTDARPPSTGTTETSTIDHKGIFINEISFQRNEKISIKALSFSLEMGKIYSFVGKNGSGKSTIAKIVAGIITPDSGQVFLNGTSIESIPPEKRHDFSLYIPQSTSLFNRTILENITYPPAKISEEEAQSCLRTLRFHDNPGQIDLSVVVSESGINLSGGQIKKIEICRALHMESKLLILDEITAGLDHASEDLAFNMIKDRFSKRNTVVFITHSADIAKKSDQVVYIKNGEISAIGHHDDLLSEFQEYREYWLAEKRQDNLHISLE
ncbi:ATP-binding cassette domain-containing protein [Burkholderia gladioli]|uniref:ATP-binding cassette domain-containing protein n=1 Tax=Burkholderia gladioli TaxID=28095 RepID=UPI001360B2B6|nr:ABC transporter ATP-binding protein [Burkholderia gladioli]MBW5283399.1 ABC transporter ATP-binding protein [Burkholderia gladioli]